MSYITKEGVKNIYIYFLLHIGKHSIILIKLTLLITFSTLDVLQHITGLVSSVGDYLRIYES